MNRKAEYHREYYLRNKEQILSHNRGYYQTHRKQIAQCAKRYAQTHKEQMRATSRDYNLRHQTERRQGQREVARALKIEILTHYSNGKCVCVQCSESRLACLSIDHIDNLGAEHRRKLGTKGKAFYRWLKNQGYPDGYQTLCMNCQWVKKEAYSDPQMYD